MKKAALLSVSDKEGLVPFARKLVDLGYTILSTSGTGALLRENQVPFLAIEEYTGQPEILDGRVKTLHPKVHAGLLARRESSEHMKQLEQSEILPIEIAVINLYPFEKNLASEKVHDPAAMVELVDIGGPTMIRAAAKNYRSVYAVVSPSDYNRVLACLEGETSENERLRLRLELARQVFARLADYNLQIAKYFSNVSLADDGSYEIALEDEFELGGVAGKVLERAQTLRYGENPHQCGAFFRPVAAPLAWKQLGGKELSFNNFLDFDAALAIAEALPADKPAAAIIKHLNPCGAAIGGSLREAIERAKFGDPRSHFGGIIAVNQIVTKDAAEEIGKDFVEIVVAPGFSPEALELLQRKKNVRLIEVESGFRNRFEYRSAAGGVLVQERDPGVSSVERAELVSRAGVADDTKGDLALAWSVCAHVKSNAIAIVKDGVLLAAGAGQMSRIDAVEVALLKARTHGHDLKGAVVASDAFFPFTDCVEVLAAEGIRAIIVPGGAKRDDEVIAAADSAGVTLLFAPDRHFRH